MLRAGFLRNEVTKRTIPRWSVIDISSVTIMQLSTEVGSKKRLRAFGHDLLCDQ